MPQHCRLTFLLLAVCLAVFNPSRACALDAPAKPRIQDVSIGFGGTFKVGYWTPVRITVTPGPSETQAQLTLTTADPDGVSATFADPTPIHVVGDSPVTVTRYIKFGQRASKLTIELLENGAIVSTQEIAGGDLPKAMSSDHEWILTIGPNIGVAEAAKSARVTAIDDLTMLPTDWFGYEAVNTCVVSASDGPLLKSITSEQFTALEQWVEQGGQVVLCVGESAAETIGPDQPLARFVPGTFSRVQTVRSLTSLESYVASSQSLDSIRSNGRAADLKICMLDDVVGRVSVYEQASDGIRPIVVRAPTGFGQVVFVAVDLDQAPYSDWSDRARLVEKLLRGDIDKKRERAGVSGTSGQLVHLGYDDLTGQLRTAAEQFSGVKLIPFSWVAGLIVIYIVLIGPADYFFLRDVLRRMSWTWVTFPLIAVAFCAIAVLLLGRFKSNDVKINQIDLVDVDLDRAVVRGTTWTHLFSPESASYELELKSSWLDGDDDNAGGLLAWQGLPGSGLGGLESPSARLFNASYQITTSTSKAAISDSPVEIGGTKAFLARWWNEAKLESTADLHLDPGGLLRGNVMNPLPVELSDCVLLYDNWAYKLERKGSVLQPGDSTPIHLEKPLNFSWRLTRRRVVNIKDITTPWEQRDTDVPRILEMMMFHGAAGGDGYTQLRHRYQKYVDLSDHLINGRAILLGRAKQPASEIVVNGDASGRQHDQRWTFYRVVFPVDDSKANSSR